ncbi:ATP-binding protein [Pseudomarimonas salicorniae]|uniref:histidine kinase n=1 Tax=Pseudomarimonas salicorniae TaxID=2933270 RepID=A0ABT0GLT9_9GAMM|nr:ATP-binding protein [Lysobacter sp. CAU 1642]MCK7594990.1 ATP-binding protein [Lysobacter sp. CAU 1642]
MTRGGPHSLGLKVALAVLLGSLAAALLTAVLQAWLLWREARESALQRLVEIEESYLPSLASSLWVIDQARVDVLLDGIQQLPEVGAVALVDEMGQRSQRGAPLGEAALATRRFPLIYEDAGERFELGRIEVELHQAHLVEQILVKLQAMAVGTLVALAMAALLTLFLLRRWVSRPLQALAETADALELDDLSRSTIAASADVPTSSELGRLVSSFEKMRGRLAEALERRETSERELSAYRGQLEQLVAQRTAELRRQNEELDAYAHTVAHDLKHPLTTLSGAGVLLRDADDRLPPEQRQTLLDSIIRSARLMERIIDALLLLARARSDADVPRQPVRPDELIAATCSRLAALAESVGARIEQIPGPGEALGHAPWIEEALVNYLSNALRYGGDPPRVRIGSDPPQAGQLKMWVRDLGPGVADDLQDRLFDSFVRPDVRKADSHGLGLSIVKRVIERQGGTVGYRRTAKAETEFWLSLPART